MRSTISLIRSALVWSVAVSFVVHSASGQTASVWHSGLEHEDRFPLSLADSILTLKHQFILPGSESVMVDSVRLNAGEDYSIDTRSGILTIYHYGSVRDRSASEHAAIIVRYRALPLAFKHVYRQQEPVTRVDTVAGGAVRFARPTTPFSVDDLFGANLQKSGSIVRGFTIGSNKDLSLNSGFRMQMSGKIASDLEVVAALTDENSPIQPEGTTQTLQELDKVFVEIRNANLNATLGDFVLDLDGNEFGRLSRKLQGARGVGSFQRDGTSASLMLSGATTRGKFHSMQFQGIDGVQGPYRLSGRNGEREIIVIAGTERVYVNGELMTRGEISDYTIDYSSGEVTFTSRRLVSGVSRIVVDFEYSDRQYSRNLMAAKASAGFFDNTWKLNATIIREADDENNPIDVSLSDADKDTLRAAGGDRLKAVRSGVQFVGPGNGQYVAIDTTIVTPSGPPAINYTYYRYAPGDSLHAVYSVVFGFVGDGRGDYRRISLNQYEFVGIRAGSYAPVRFLPMPESNSLADVDLSAQVTRDLKFTGEVAHSAYDANKFSPVRDADAGGSAVRFGMHYNPGRIGLFGNNLGSLDLRLSERYIDRRFVSLDRINDVEFNRKWNVRADVNPENEETREGSLGYKPVDALSISGGIGQITRGELFSSHRYVAGMLLSDSTLPRTRYDVEFIRSRDATVDVRGEWTRHRAEIDRPFGMVTPRLQVNGEVLRNRTLSLDTLQAGSFRFAEIVPGLSFVTLGPTSLDASAGWRWDDSLADGSLKRASTTFTNSYDWRLREWNAFSSTLTVTLQNRSYAPAFRQRNPADINVMLVRSQTRFNPFDRGIESDWFYEVATERSGKLERVFQRVPRGTGNYTYIGDANQNNIVDEGDFQLIRFDGDFVAVAVPTEQLIPVTNVRASSRLRFNGSRLAPQNSTMGAILSALSSETYVRIEEKSTTEEKRQIYLLHLSHFLNDRTTLAGSNLISQDVFVLENSPDLSVRLRFVQRKGLTQLSLLNERTYTRERSLRLRWVFVKEIANQIDYVEKTDRLDASQSSSRARNVHVRNVLSDWSYRPDQDWEVGFRIGVGRGTNYDTTTANLNELGVRTVYSIESRGRARAELTREEVRFDRPVIVAPFELTNGKAQGKTWLWTLSLDYRVTSFVQSSIQYQGRSENRARPVHTATAEVRAFF
jgi:hypothetical protein